MKHRNIFGLSKTLKTSEYKLLFWQVIRASYTLGIVFDDEFRDCTYPFHNFGIRRKLVFLFSFQLRQAIILFLPLLSSVLFSSLPLSFLSSFFLPFLFSLFPSSFLFHPVPVSPSFLFSLLSLHLSSIFLPSLFALSLPFPFPFSLSSLPPLFFPFLIRHPLMARAPNRLGTSSGNWVP